LYTSHSLFYQSTWFLMSFYLVSIPMLSTFLMHMIFIPMITWFLTYISPDIGYLLARLFRRRWVRSVCLLCVPLLDGCCSGYGNQVVIVLQGSDGGGTVVRGDVVVLWWWDVEMLTWWCLDLVLPVCGWCRVWLNFYDTRFFDYSQILRFSRFFLSLWWFSNLLIFAGFFVSSQPLPHRCWLFGGGLGTEIYRPRFSFNRCPINFWLKEVFFGFW
jgi:hypothetical protein